MRGSALALAVWLLARPELAWACATCFDPNDQNRQAFLDTTIFLSLLPLALIGGGVYYAYRRYQEIEGR